MNTKKSQNKMSLFNEIKNLIIKKEEINISKLSKKWNVDRKTVRKYKNKLLKNLDLEYDTIKRKYDKPKTAVFKKHENFIIERIESIKTKTNGSLVSVASLFFAFKRYLERIKEDQSIITSLKFSTFQKYIKENFNYSSFKTRTNFKTALKESLPAENLEIDWAENVLLYLTNGQHLLVNILILKLSFSRKISFQLTFDKKEDTLIKMIIFSLITWKGVPNNLICDNMKTIVQKNNGYNKVVLNKKFEAFAKDFGMNVKPCNPNTPQQKGKVEADVKIAKWVKANSGNFKDINEIIQYLKDIENDFNTSLNLSTGLTPNNYFEICEKDRLQKLPNQSVIDSYLNSEENRIVKKNCSISFLSNVFYLDPFYIEKTVQVYKENNTVYIKYDNKIIYQFLVNQVRNHKFLDLDTQTAILKRVYENQGIEIDEAVIINQAKKTCTVLDIQYKIKTNTYENDYDKLLKKGKN